MQKFPIVYIDGQDSVELRDKVVAELKKRKLYEPSHLYRTFNHDRLETMLERGTDRTNDDGKGDSQFERDFAKDIELMEIENPDSFGGPLDYDPENTRGEPVHVSERNGYDIGDSIHASTEKDAEEDELTAWKLAMDYKKPAMSVYRSSHLDDTISGDTNEYVFKQPAKKLDAVVAVFTVGWKYKAPKKKKK